MLSAAKNLRSLWTNQILRFACGVAQDDIVRCTTIAVSEPAMRISEIRLAIEAITNDATLTDDAGFVRRYHAIDHLEFDVVDRIDGLLQAGHPPDELLPLRQVAERVLHDLEAIDTRLFQRLRAEIRRGRYRGARLKRLIDDYIGSDHQPDDSIGYDHRDVFLNGLLAIQGIPPATLAGEPEMVSHQQTPARIIFGLAERVQRTEADVFYDIGSGLGHVPIMLHLLCGVTARGIEREPAYCMAARETAAGLDLAHLSFLEADARSADYSAGTIFFLYTPVRGRMLQAVLERLRGESQQRGITLITYGPCTLDVARQAWLTRVDQDEAHPDNLAVFRS
jgi:hypothetical protein